MAVVVFALLVTTQTFRDWPLVGLGLNGGEGVSVSSGRPAPGDGSATTGATAGAGGTAAPSGAGGGVGAASGPGGGPAATSPAPGSSPGGLPGSTAPAGGGGSSPAGAGSNQVGGGGGPGSTASTGGGGWSPSGTVANTVNDPVSGIDSALGGMLGDAGIAAVTEDVAGKTAGPGSRVGKSLDKTVESVGGLPGGSR